ncbi:MAG TPA: [protein-PII] uridylyltransferase [Motilibacterales bacterium]|nr:[protein-PII] uridylyltransferase [Motilibacterales bacterium]
MSASTSELSPGNGFLAARADLLAAKGRPNPQSRLALSKLTDEWLIGLFEASGAGQAGATLVAVGGYGRGEMSAGSDLDLVLLHPGGSIAEVADRLWYPIWDSGLRLDHSVRTVSEARRVAASDIKVVLGLLDARTVAGDETATSALRTSVLADWRALAPRRLPDLHASVRERTTSNGELAHLLEPDIKESYGGLRDLTVLRAVAASWVTDAPHAELAPAKALLLDVRDALHRVASRPTDRLAKQEQGPVAEVLRMADADTLLRDVSAAGRSVGVASDITWHAVERIVRSRPKLGFKRLTMRGPTRSPLADGVVLQDGESVLAADARPDRDPTLILRAAAAAAQSGHLLSRHAVTRLAAESAPMPVPWPASARDALVSLLGAGRSAVPIWESLDQAGVITSLIPYWDVVRSAPQHNPVHRYTVDRHLLEAAVQACAFTREVHRPDLLLVGALLHDIGKGRPGQDHTDVGVGLVAEIAEHMGFGSDDRRVLVDMCRHHLLLPETATRRDLDDPQTIDTVAQAVGSAELLDLLAALTRADALATGPLAWTSWKRSLVADLVDRVRNQLAGEELPVEPRLSDDQLAMASGEGVRVLLQEHESGFDITVGAPDSLGLLGLVAGILSMHRLEVRSAVTTVVGDRAIEVWGVNPQFGDPPSVDRLREDIRRAILGQLDVTARLARRDEAIRAPSGAPASAPARVEIVAGASSRATVMEVRAHDAPGLLHRVGTAIAATGTDIAAARVSTLGSEVVDVFYLVDRHGDALDADLAEAVAEAVADALAEPRE